MSPVSHGNAFVRRAHARRGKMEAMRCHLVGLVFGLGVGCGDSSSTQDAAPVTDGDVDGPSSDASPDAPIDAPPVTPIAPQTMNSSLRLEVGHDVSGMLLASDSNGDTLTYSIMTQPTRGTVSAFDPATGAFTYQSTNLVAGTDTIRFQVTDGVLSAPTPGIVTITVEPILFTGYWALTNVTDNGAACSNATFRLGHAIPQGGAGFFRWAERRISCGSTTYTIDPVALNITGGNVTDSVMTFSRSEFVSGCGTVTEQSRLERTATGFDYRTVLNTPCFGIGTHTILAQAVRTETAYLVANTSIAFGNVRQGTPATNTISVRNLGRPIATALMATAPMAPFGFIGGSYPGTSGTCGTELAGLASCSMTVMLDSTALYSGGTTTVNTSYMDAMTTRIESTSISGTVIPNLVGVTGVGAGNSYTCALHTPGVVCWGSSSSTPSQVPTLSSPTVVTTGSAHACALDATGVVCWGDNTSGQATVPALINPRAVSAGGAHTCALDDTGVVCWGSNTSGQATVPPLTSPTMVSAGWSHTCAVHATGVACWGTNTSGQATVPPLTNPTAVSAGTSHTCALDATGGRCWGSDTFGRATPPPLTNPTAIAVGSSRSCAIHAGGTLICWGFAATSTPSISGATAISIGSTHACAVTPSGLRCWGSPSYP